MPDISMCGNKNCPSRKSCYRFTAKPNPYKQTYAFLEVKEGEKQCDSYWLDDRVKYNKGEIKPLCLFRYS